MLGQLDTNKLILLIQKTMFCGWSIYCIFIDKFLNTRDSIFFSLLFNSRFDNLIVLPPSQNISKNWSIKVNVFG